MSDKSYYVGEGQVGTFAHDVEVLPVAQLASGFNVNVRVLTVYGAHDGPTIGITAGIHGDEHTGTEIVRRVVTSVNPSELSGRIEAIPVVNPLAFEAGTRNTPVDMLNLNRIFPGDRGGWFSDRLAAVIRHDYLPGIDFLIDLHAGGVRGWVDYVIAPSDREVQLATGTEFVYHGEAAGTGTSKDAARDAGVKETLTMEFGGLNCSSGPMVDKGVTCIMNMLKYWGALSGEPVRAARQYIFTEKTVLRSGHGGLFYQNPDTAVIGKQIPKDALLATIVDPYTFEVLEEVRAPYDNNLVFHVLAFDGLAQAGDFLFQCANMDSTEVITNS